MTKFNEKTRNAIIEYLKEGHYQKTAAALAGVHEATFYRWIERGKKAKTGKYREFCESVKKAEEYAKAYHLQQIIKSSQKGNWQASAWFLERKAPDEWGRRQRVEMEHSGKIEKKVDFDIHERVKMYEKYFKEDIEPDD